MNLSAPNNQRADAKRLATIVALSALAIGCGSGCQFSRIKSFDLDMGGLELEYWAPAGEEEPGFFGQQPGKTLQAIPANYPRLMQRASR